MTQQTQPADQMSEPAQPPLRVFWTSRKILALAVLVSLALGFVLGGTIRPFDRPSPSSQRETMSSTDRAPRPLPNYDSLTHYCPDRGSKEETEKAIGSLTIDSMANEDFLVMGDRPVVRIIGSGSTTGLIRICGEGARLVISEPHLNLKVFFGAIDAKVIVVDPKMSGVDYVDHRNVFADGAMSVNEEGCTTQGLPGIRSCDSYLLS